MEAQSLEDYIRNVKQDWSFVGVQPAHGLKSKCDAILKSVKQHVTTDNDKSVQIKNQIMDAAIYLMWLADDFDMKDELKEFILQVCQTNAENAL